MKTEVYYFSGTGNSLYVAKDIAALLDAELIPIASAAKKDIISSEADVVGIVFPVYISELPIIVKRFAEKLSAKAGYIFAIATFGGASGMSLYLLKDILAKNNLKLSAGFGVHMPQNAFYKWWEKPERVYGKWEKKKGKLAHRISERKEGFFLSNLILEFVLRKLHNPLIKPMFRKSILEMTGADESMDTDDIIHITGKCYEVSDDCNGCGVCAGVCPVGNIQINGGRPVWGSLCEGCLACLNYCPKEAISGGFSKDGFRYKNLRIKIAEIKAQKL